MSNTIKLTIGQIMRLMQASNDEGTIHDTRISPNPIQLTELLRQRGATAEQAAKAARRLGWASTSHDDWSDAL